MPGLIAWLLYAVSLLPIWILSLYNFPSADDINMGIPAHEAFTATGNIFAAWGKGLYMAWYDYLHWMGYFTSTALMSVPPSVFGEQFYCLGVPILTLSLSAATAFFLYTLLVSLIGMEKSSASVVTALTLFFTVQSLPPGTPRLEAFFWYCSGANYILTWSLGLCFLALFVRVGLSDTRSLRPVILCSAIGFLTGGGNYMTALTCAIITVLTLIWLALPAHGGIKAPVFRRLAVPVLFFLAGFAASCLAPGNAVREEIVSGFGPAKTIAVAIYYTLSFCMRQWTRPEHLLLLLFLAPLFWRQAPKARLSFRFPLLIVILSPGLAAANMTPPLYALGNIDAGRLQALAYIQYLLLLVLTEGYLIGWLRIRVLRPLGDAGAHEENDMRLRWYQSTLIAVFVIISALSAGVSSDYYTATEALHELADGSAAAYRAENEARLNILKNPDVTNADLTAFSHRPALLFYSDIEADPNSWLNDGLARYYHKERVRLILPDSVN
ncbi:MAG: DUF6056 family protein [Lachnospiraceae bacterium]|nr:DUF6056 family protein [Lachnospiraceae bacterium]